MDLKLLLQYPKAVQVLLAALQKSPASLPKLEKLLPPEIPAAALLSAAIRRKRIAAVLQFGYTIKSTFQNGK